VKAVTWQGVTKLGVENVPEPQLLRPRDAIVRVTLATICGSDLHLYDGFIPTMEHGDIIGHEFMGEVVSDAFGGIEPGDTVLLARVAAGEVDATFPITHRMTFDDAKHAFETFKHKHGDCCRVVLRPH
jgi:threonine dehydrogenase-like Zn-dependent dehydrogenase